MRLSERLKVGNGTQDAAPPLAARPGTPVRKVEEGTFTLKSRVHRALIERLDFSKLTSMDREKLEEEFQPEIANLLRGENPSISSAEEKHLTKEILDEIFGLGPIEPLLHDPSIEEIMVNNAGHVYCGRSGKISLTNIIFQDDEHLLHIIERIVSRVGRRIDESSPMVDARLLDGSRVNAIIPPLALDGPCLTIRLFPSQRIRPEDLVAYGTLTKPMMELLRGCVLARLNMLVSGGTASGKTTFLNVLSSFIPSDERIITIEDSAELQLQQDHVIRLETRPPNLEAQGEITGRALVRNALRMRPDRIVVGEVRGEEAMDMLQAMNTGHEGSISTIHANSPRDALSRLEVMVAMSGFEMPLRALRQQIASALDVIIQTARLKDGSRKVTAISEITGMEEDMISMQDIFVFREEGLTAGGKVVGQFIPSGTRPKFMDKLSRLDIQLDEDLFTAIDAEQEAARWNSP